MEDRIGQQAGIAQRWEEEAASRQLQARKARLESEKGKALLEQKIEFLTEECRDKTDKISRLQQ